MNRRGFLKLLGIAPAVAPQIAQTAATTSGSAEFIVSQVDLINIGPSKSLARFLDHLNGRGECYAWLDADVPSVLDQMREHDLFDLSGETA